MTARGRPGLPAGLSLLELMLALAAFGMVAVALGGLLATGLSVSSAGGSESQLHQSGALLLERIVSELRTTDKIGQPSAGAPTGSVLNFSVGTNADNDYYLGDVRLPRRDEDPPLDLNLDGAPGIAGVDDDGDGQVDEGGAMDDDEDGMANEDGYDFQTYRHVASRILELTHPDGSKDSLATNVSAFSAGYSTAPGTGAVQIQVSLTLDDGRHSVQLTEYVLARNLSQLNGKVTP